jgi:hypothetical protein
MSLVDYLKDAVTFVRCPNTNKVIFTTKDDDKVMCSCNPTGLHKVADCRPATVDDWKQQEGKA